MSNSLAETAGAQALLKSVSEETGIPVEELNGEKAFSLANQGNEKALAGIRNHAKNWPSIFTTVSTCLIRKRSQ